MSTVRYIRQCDHGANVEKLEMRTTGDDLKATIRIGGVNYSVDVSKISYLESFVRLQTHF